MRGKTEVADLLRAAVPQLELPEAFDEASLVICVEDATDVRTDADGEIVGVRFERGVPQHSPSAINDADAWLRGAPSQWLDHLVEGDASGLQVGGAGDLVELALARLGGVCAPALATP
jgi:hypothetical protein